MLDLRQLRENPNRVKAACGLRGLSMDQEIEALLSLDEERRALLRQVEGMRARQNEMRQALIVEKDRPQAEPLCAALRQLCAEIEEVQARCDASDERVRALLWRIPNLPGQNSPQAPLTQRVFGAPKRFPYEARTAKSLLQKKELCRGQTLFGIGARLERAVAAFLFDRLLSAGFFESAAACLDGEAVFFPFRDQLLEQSELPTGRAVYRAREAEPLFDWPVQAGSVELLRLAQGETDLYEMLCAPLVEAFSLLGLSSRLTALSAATLPFEASRAVLLEIWMPSARSYRPVGVVSEHQSFLARRFGCRYRVPGARPLPVCSAGGAVSLAGLASALVEHGQNGDGSVSIPEPLRPMVGIDRIKR